MSEQQYHPLQPSSLWDRERLPLPLDESDLERLPLPEDELALERLELDDEPQQPQLSTRRTTLTLPPMCRRTRRPKQT